jgi:hypothetical protein
MQQTATVGELIETFLSEVEVVRTQLLALDLSDDDLKDFAEGASLTPRDILLYRQGKTEPTRPVHMAIRQELGQWVETPLPGGVPSTPAPVSLSRRAVHKRTSVQPGPTPAENHEQLVDVETTGTRENIARLVESMVKAYSAGLLDELELHFNDTHIISLNGKRHA